MHGTAIQQSLGASSTSGKRITVNLMPKGACVEPNVKKPRKECAEHNLWQNMLWTEMVTLLLK